MEKFKKYRVDILSVSGIMKTIERQNRMVILYLILPLFFYTVAVRAAGLVLPLPALPVTAIGALAVLPFLGSWYRRDQKRREILSGAAAGPRKRWEVRDIAWIILLGAAACLVCNDLIRLSGLMDRFSGFGRAAGDLYAPALPVQILCTALIIPSAEELIFRGLMFAPIREKTSFVMAAFWSSFLFGLYHGNLVQGIYAFGLGLFMAWLYERYQTLLAPWLFHISANLVSVCVTASCPGILLDMDRPAGYAAAAMSILCLMAGVYKIFCMTKKEEEA